MSEDVLAEAAEVWSAIHGDPQLIDGLMMGQLGVLIDAYVYLQSVPQVQAGTPIGLALRLSRVTADTPFYESLEVLKEAFSLPSIRWILDAEAGLTDR